MPPPVSATLAMWATAWLNGDVGYDDVLDAVTPGAQTHVVIGLPASESARYGRGEPARNEYGPGERPGGRRSTDEPGVPGSAPPSRLGAVLIAWRATGSPVRAVLPVPGDVRGTPSSPSFLSAAVDAGQGVYGGGIALVPLEAGPSPSSAPPVLTWRAFVVGAAAPDAVQLSEAEHDLAVAVRETATLLRDRDLTGGRAPDARQLERIRRASDGLRLPTGFPPRAAALLASAERLQAMLDLASGDVDGGAIDRGGIDTRMRALRELSTTVRRARLAGYNAGAGMTAPS